MPWKEQSVMNEKIRFINEVNARDESLAALCREFGIARKTAYKWMKRYQEHGNVIHLRVCSLIIRLFSDSLET